ncbi:hypothetical protein RIF29_39357 [Crotalaria pallida]|uniref:Uncharacterized protein n=1 Tax=Crotalaria pallida TaxID=3830 RepID=A0AAN9E0Z8_CROPI
MVKRSQLLSYLSIIVKSLLFNVVLFHFSHFSRSSLLCAVANYNPCEQIKLLVAEMECRCVENVVGLTIKG